MKDTPLRKLANPNFAGALKVLDWNLQGKVCDVVGTIVEATLPQSRLATVAKIEVNGQDKPVLAEVVGFRGDRTLLLPFNHLQGISPGARVSGQTLHDRIPVGSFLLGKVVDPFINCLSAEGMQVPRDCAHIPIERDATNPLLRARISNSLCLGIRALDGLLTFCEGQRMGIMAGSGVGKSVLLGMIAKGSAADVNVIGLIGERGREVREFLERDLGPEGLKRSVVVAVTSDQSPLMRLRGAKAVTAIAEYFASQGKRVLLMMDSLTRVAQAQREIGLSIGEPPTAKGYPPSVFSLLPKLLERCGPQAKGVGSISGLYSVLVDGDDFNDPIPDAVRAILDGHINLSRSLANKGHFPAIDVTTSISRVMNDIVDPRHIDLANKVRALLAEYQENVDYIQIGSYQEGSNPVLDLAIKLMPRIENFLCQGVSERASFDDSIRGLIEIFQMTS